MNPMTDPVPVQRRHLRGRLDEPADVEVGTVGTVGAGDAVVAGALSPRTWVDQFRLWFEDATADPAVVEANAMQVATVDPSGHPAVRTVLLKGFDDRGVVFYTNYASAKARDLDANPYAAAVLLWMVHERQVRISGPVSRVSNEETDAYFASRPRGSQLGAWASPQSAVIDSRADLERQFADVEARFAGGPVPTPPHWGGYRIEPAEVEFWQGRADRLHDRLRYRRDGGRWMIERLAP
jgi:pyridoxamine 5'-phosphate oxidase